jgi:hypothetical protein
MRKEALARQMVVKTASIRRIFGVLFAMIIGSNSRTNLPEEPIRDESGKNMEQNNKLT